jgi:hypothetical protein
MDRLLAETGMTVVPASTSLKLASKTIAYRIGLEVRSTVRIRIRVTRLIPEAALCHLLRLQEHDRSTLRCEVQIEDVGGKVADMAKAKFLPTGSENATPDIQATCALAVAVRT